MARSTLTANIRRRRGTKVAINMPIFHDTNTPRPFIDPTIPRENLRFPEYQASDARNALPDHIYMDAMGFGMGCCCLQITFQACNIDEARRLYDHLAPISPIMMALTAATPVFRGYLADVDCRWNVISQSVDDRTDQERGVKPLTTDRFVINKSRYAAIDSYLSSSDGRYKPAYNDIPLVYDRAICQQLQESDVDPLLARHIAHLFIRDPLVIFEELLDVDDTQSSDHFENIQSTNWQSMRFKPPPPNSPIGWRVEFRTMEIQFTDFENAAYTVFAVLLTRALLSFDLNFYIPISKLDANMATAHKPNARLHDCFYFRKHVFPIHSAGQSTKDTKATAAEADVSDEYTLMTVDEIINGKEGGFQGLIPIINAYLDSVNTSVDTRHQINRYLDLISKRANGTLMTNATWIRQFIREHPLYHQDSVVSPEINYDLLKAIQEISDGQQVPPELYP
ncbi:glutamate--cysteine ligase [Dimargaris xerosporica]|nr:glutamate--cysteine ligase [Dimargaris xerosporica]